MVFQEVVDGGGLEELLVGSPLRELYGTLQLQQQQYCLEVRAQDCSVANFLNSRMRLVLNRSLKTIRSYAATVFHYVIQTGNLLWS